MHFHKWLDYRCALPHPSLFFIFIRSISTFICPWLLCRWLHALMTTPTSGSWSCRWQDVLLFGCAIRTALPYSLGLILCHISPRCLHSSSGEDNGSPDKLAGVCPGDNPRTISCHPSSPHINPLAFVRNAFWVPLNMKFFRCSSLLYKTEQYLHVTCSPPPPPDTFKYLWITYKAKYNTRAVSIVNVLYFSRNNDKKKSACPLPMLSA